MAVTQIAGLRRSSRGRSPRRSSGGRSRIGVVAHDTQKFNALQKIAVEESPSKIPLLFALDVIHGFAPSSLCRWRWLVMGPSVAERARR